MFLWFIQPDTWLALITLTSLKIILGVDNIVLLSLVVIRLLLLRQNMTRKLGLSCATIMRVLLLISIAWFSHITQPLFIVLVLEISFRMSILPEMGYSRFIGRYRRYAKGCRPRGKTNMAADRGNCRCAVPLYG